MQKWMATDLTEETECRVEMSGTQTHDRKQEPDQVNAATDIPGVVTEETDEDGGEDEKYDVTDLQDDRHFIRKGQTCDMDSQYSRTRLCPGAVCSYSRTSPQPQSHVRALGATRKGSSGQSDRDFFSGERREWRRNT